MINLSPTVMGADPSYAFAVGRIRVLETRLLSNQQTLRLLETKDVRALWDELAKLQDYEQHLGRLRDPHEFESLLNAELKRVYGLVFALDPKGELLRLLALRHDFHNCKVLSKGRLLGEDPTLALSGLGLYPVREWEQLLSEGDDFHSDSIPAELLAVIRRVNAELETEQDLRRRDLLWDRALYRYLERKFRLSGNVFAQSWLKLRLDCINFSMFMRCKQQRAPRRVLEEGLLEGGAVPAGRLLEAYAGQVEELPQRFAASPYAELLQEGVQAYSREGCSSTWEKLVDDFEIEFLKQSRLVAMGVEPLFAYLLAKENELKVLRIILVGKLNKLDKAQIGRRLRRLYA